jgi:hypothetical protein
MRKMNAKMRKLIKEIKAGDKGKSNEDFLKELKGTGRNLYIN